MTEPWPSADDTGPHIGVTRTAEKNMTAQKIGRLRKVQVGEVDSSLRNDGAAVPAGLKPS